jgi:hypothetical protein
MIFNDTYRSIRPMASFRAIKNGKKYKHLLNFPRSNTAGTLLVMHKSVQV